MILIRSLRLDTGENISALKPRAAKALGCPAREIREMKLVKRSLDARKKNDIHYVCSVAVSVPGEEKYLALNRHISPICSYRPPVYEIPEVLPDSRPVVVGFGPAGMFAALVLARAGARPIVLERGQPVEQLAGTGSLEDRLELFYRENGCGMYARYRAFIWRDHGIHPVEHPDRTTLRDLKGYEIQRRMAIDNTVAFLVGLPANNCLLYGDRGTGKSSTVKAILNEYYTRGLRMIEMPKESLMDFPRLVDQIAPLPMRFILFIDDLSFSSQDDTYAALKAVLEGGLAARPAHTLIYATSNRRHLVRETFSDREGDEVHKGDTIQESLSLADRFGLSIRFSVPDKWRYLEIVRQLAVQRGLEDHLDELEGPAERWATERGGRSPRCARQFIDDAEARIRRGEPLR